MPIAMNYDLLKNSNRQAKLEHLDTHETHLNIKLSKSPLSNGTNRPPSAVLSAPTPPVKPRVRPTPVLAPISRTINLEQLSRCQSARQFDLPNVADEKWLALAASNEHILVGGGSSSTLRLFDLHGKEVHVIDIKTFAAFDVAWSSTLKAFLIAGYDRLQMYNVEKNELTEIDHLHQVNKKDNYFWSIACHGNDLFIVLSDGLESIWRLSLPSFKRIQTLSGSEIRESNADDRISCIRTNGHTIGMTIRQRKTFQWRVDLFDYASMTCTHRGLTLGCGTGAFNFVERCMLAALDDHQWLVIGGYGVTPNALTLMDDRTGEIRQVERPADRQQEFISNICTSENSKRERIISMMTMSSKSGQCQMHVVDEEQVQQP